MINKAILECFHTTRHVNRCGVFAHSRPGPGHYFGPDSQGFNATGCSTGSVEEVFSTFPPQLHMLEDTLVREAFGELKKWQ